MVYLIKTVQQVWWCCTFWQSCPELLPINPASTDIALQWCQPSFHNIYTWVQFDLQVNFLSKRV